jgi:molecular chaperone GrpE (heat shock protein)
MAGVLERVELALCPRQHASDVAAEEHALLNLLDSIVDRRTEALLLPVARLAAQLDRAGRTADSALRERLERDARVELEEVLGALGLERISAAQGDELQPLLHEEVGEAAVPGLEEGLVAELVRAGYRVRGGRVLLPALVLVAAAADP